MGYKTLELKIVDKVAIITLNRPDDANSLNLEMANELLKIATICDSDPNIRAVVLTANGKMFSGGGDLPSFKKQGDKLSEYLRLTTTGLHMAISRFKRMNAPFIVAVNGTAAGAGFSIAISGDLVFSSDSARFTVAYTKIGVSPDGGSTWMLPRIVGEKKAMELMLLNPVLKAKEALQLGLISRIYPEADLLEESFVNITIYDMLGNVVNNLVNTKQSSGYKSVQWNATDNLGQPVSAGVYLYSIETKDFRQTKKMILLK